MAEIPEGVAILDQVQSVGSVWQKDDGLENRLKLKNFVNYHELFSGPSIMYTEIIN